MQLQPFIIKYIFERQDWPVDFFGKLKHQIMVVCRCCKESRIQLLQLPNIFLPIENDMPEDICYYRNGNLWFATISHEKMAFMVDATNKDVAFFMKMASKFTIKASLNSYIWKFFMSYASILL